MKANPNKAQVNACTKWCVVEGFLVQENKAMWKRIHLVGGKAMISNSFGKRVPFVLKPCGITTPENYEDNYICGSCVRENEAALRLKGNSSSVHSSVTQQEADNSGNVSFCFSMQCISSLPLPLTNLWLFSHSYLRKRERETLFNEGDP